jgi:hypothetical protein
MAQKLPPGAPTQSSLILPRVAKNPTKSMTAKTWAPVSYTSEVTGLTAGETLLLPQVSLQSGFSTPYLVDEIRFTAYTATAVPATLGSNDAPFEGDIASILSYQLWTGGLYFSRGGFGQTAFVPMSLYAPTYSGRAVNESVLQTETAATARRFSTRRWVLPKPLYMAAGDIIQASVARDVTVASGYPAITAQITVIGRALPPDAPVPQVRQVPFVAYYIHPSSSTYSEANFQLQNPNRSTWHVQRMIAATRCDGEADYGTGLLQSMMGFAPGGTSTTASTLRYAKIKLTDSLGYKITSGPGGGFVALGDLASPTSDSAWTFSRPLPPNENYNLSVQIVPGTSTNAAFDTMIGFVGYRDE